MMNWLSRFTRGVVLGAAMVAGTLASAPLAAQAAPVYIVDDDGVECPGAPYTDIGDAAFAAGSNPGTIQVCPGQYAAFSVWNARSLTIKAKNPANRPEVLAPNTADGRIVWVFNSSKLTIDGLYLNGDPFDDAAGGYMYGIDWGNSSGTIQNNIIRGITDPIIGDALAGRAISVVDSDDNGKISAVAIRNNLVARYNTVGIYVAGAVKATITGNRLDGVDGLSGPLPAIGIDLRAGTGTPAGIISKNLISHNYFGVQLYEVSRISVTGNTINDTGYAGVSIESNCLVAGRKAVKNKVSGNTITRSVNFAVYLASSEYPWSVCDPQVSLNVIAKNTFTDTSASSGEAVLVGVWQDTSDPDPDPVARSVKNVITGNTIWGYGAPVSIFSGATGTVVTKNILIVAP